MLDAPSGSRARVALWLALCIVLQSLLALRHEVAMVTGVDICTADGAKRVNGQGERLDGAHPIHACCLMADLAAPPPSGVDARVVLLVAAAPARTLPVDWISAQWAAPLSRGPPVLV